MRKNTVVKDTNAVNVATVTSLPSGNAPPVANAPDVPDGWEKSTRINAKENLKPTVSQVEASPGAASEMQTSTTWVADFGSKAPDPAVLAAKLTTASAWRDAWVLATLWTAYCAEQRGIWEDDALHAVADLKPLFDYADARDPTITKRYPSTKLLVGARTVSAQRGATVRKNKKKAAQVKAAIPDLPATATPAAPANGGTPTSH